MNIRKINLTFGILVILFPLLVLSSVGYASSKVSPQSRVDFKSYDHELTQGFVNQSGEDREIFYWIQVSDVHIDMADTAKENRKNFEKFCNKTIYTVSPGFVLSSGDQVNGPLNNPDRPKNHYQSEDEYEFFSEILKENGLNSSFFYKAIGNHETYNQGLEPSLYLDNMQESTQYYLDVETPWGGKYRFICVDTTQNIGLGNPFDYWGEMKRDKLNALEGLIDDTPDSVDQVIIWGHHPIHHIYTERSDSGKTFKELIAESEASLYLCGHTHTENTYWNHGTFTELICPAFKVGSNYRILAIDNGLYSFSEEISEEWPAVVVTNPISSLLYNEHDDLEKMKDTEEIRVLIFDPKPVEEAYVKIDGEKVGELTNQTGKLWTLSYDPEDYETGDHELEVVVESDSGKTSRTLTFNMGSSVATQTDGFYKYLIAVDLLVVLSVLLALCFVLLYSFTVLPKAYYHFKKEGRKELKETTQEDFKEMGFIKRHLKKHWFQAATLPTSLWLALVLTPAYILIGPLFIGPFVNETWGGLWLYGFFILGGHALDFYSLIWGTAFLLLFIIVQNFAIRSNQPNPNKWRYVPLFFYFLVWTGVIYFYSGYFTLLVMLVNPLVLLSFGIGAYVIWESRRTQSRTKL